MKLDPTDPVQTRDGRPARIICTDSKWTCEGHRYPIVALIGEDERMCYHFCGDGRIKCGTDHDYDLINIPVERERRYWVNIYPTECCGHDSEDSAKEHTDSTLIIARKEIVIKFTDGEGLDA